MKLLIFSLTLMLFASRSRADGFVCEARHTGIRVLIRNQSGPGFGTRTPETMTLSDPLQPELPVSARFSTREKTLVYEGKGRYLGQVDLRHSDPGLRDRFLAGTRLRDLAAIRVLLEFSYSPDVIQLADAVGTIPGRIRYERRCGEWLEEPASCCRVRTSGSCTPR